MIPGFRPLLLGLICLTGLTPAASAGVVLQFAQSGAALQAGHPGTGTQFPSALMGQMSLSLTQEAFDQGLSLRQSNGGGPPLAEMEGVVGLDLALQNIADEIVSTLPDFTREIPVQSTERSAIQLTSAPGGLPVGFIFYSSPTDMSVRFTFDGTSRVTGAAVGDRSCFWGCRFEGELVVAVPEPASVLTFGLGLFVLAGAVAWRRGRAPAAARRPA